MSNAQTPSAEQIFLQASDLEPAERRAFVEKACAGNSKLRDEVDALLAAADASESYFGKLPGRLGIEKLRGESHAEEYAAAAGQQFGQYRLTEPLGKGGMGAVWRAERSDGRFEGQVAVKLLTRAESGTALQRFDREAHYLAKLTHPNIARLIDAGIGPEGVPYLIIELVEGVPIDQYCDARSLAIDERIDLFVAVLESVAHAHAHLIVHSDIKPSNVLVTSDGTVKLLDFGISRLLSEDDGENQAIALTPEFASPEQLANGPVTTSTDVYSLGLLLYLLLTGASPRRLAGTASIDELKVAAMSEPPSLASTASDTGTLSPQQLRALAGLRSASPSKLLKTLRGDLDNIVRKALAVQPQDRYQTVTDFASDLRRYLRLEPVSALPDTLNYRARKFVQRHRGGVLSAALTFIALIAAAVITTWQSIEAKRQRDVAIYQQQRVYASNEFLNILLGELGPSGEKLSLQELLDRGVALIDRQFGTNERFVAMTLYEISVLYATLGQVDRQLELLDRSESIARAVGDQGLLANALCAKARLKLEQDPAASAADLAAGKAAQAQTDPARGETIIECYRAEALTHARAGNREAAIAVYRAAIEVMDAAPVSSSAVRLLLLNDLGEQYFNADRAAEALDILDRIIETHERIGRGRTVGHVIYLANRAAVLSRMGEVARASESQRDAVERVKGMDNAPVGLDGHYGNSLLRLARFEEAMQFFESDYRAAQAAGNQRFFARAAMQIGRTLVRMKRTAEAGEYLDQAEVIFNETPEADRRQLIMVALARAEARLVDGDTAGAQVDVQTVLADLGYPDDMSAPGLSSALWSAANIALEMNDADTALQYASDELELVTGVARDANLSADVGQALLQRAKARIVLGDTDGAAVDLRNASISLGNGFGADHPEALEARQLLSQLGNQ